MSQTEFTSPDLSSPVSLTKHEQNKKDILDACYLKIFSASNMTYDYPYKLQPCDRARVGIRKTCTEFIVDSGFNKDEITNEQVLDKAAETSATYVIPKDYVGDQIATTTSVHEFLELYDDHKAKEMGIDVLIPLQPPHDEHLKLLPGFSHYALGGIKTLKPPEQVAALKKFRKVVGDDVYVHALGMGFNQDFITAIRNTPTLLDSVDMSTAERLPINNLIRDKKMDERRFEFPKGKLSSTVRGEAAAFNLLLLNYILSPNCTDEYYDEINDEGQLGLGDYE